MPQPSDLSSGDILLLLDTPDNTSTKHKGIKFGQMLTGIHRSRHNQGASDLVHAMMFVGYNCVAEASGAAGEVRATMLRSRSGTYMVYSCTDSALAQRAAGAAMSWSQRGQMGYAKRKAVMSIFHSDKFGTHGQTRAQSYANEIDSNTPTFGRGRLFCSEFVIACYQAAALDLQLGLNGSVLACDAKHCSVRALHDRLVKDALFTWMGTLHV